jgi:hypothetical protein
MMFRRSCFSVSKSVFRASSLQELDIGRLFELLNSELKKIGQLQPGSAVTSDGIGKKTKGS